MESQKSRKILPLYPVLNRLSKDLAEFAYYQNRISKHRMESNSFFIQKSKKSNFDAGMRSESNEGPFHFCFCVRLNSIKKSLFLNV